MGKKYHSALVIGKFQPLHKGHLALIDFAALKADSVIVCVTAHDGEQIPLEQREKWVKESYADNPNVIVCALSYNPAKLNSSSESDLKSSEDWADFLKETIDNFSDIDVFVGSEIYVKYMADYVGISYEIFDEQRVNIPISATDIKSNVIRYWDYLSPAVKRSYVSHICICGSESTGKSTVCKRLEEELGFVTMIPEIGRCLVGKSEMCSLLTLQKIYAIHHDLLEAVIYDPPTPIILWDTDNITTLSYFRFLYPDNDIDEITNGKNVLTAGKYFFFESNIPLHDDGTRLEADDALRLRNHHLMMYGKYGVHPEIVAAANRCDIVRQYILSESRKIQRIFAQPQATRYK